MIRHCDGSDPNLIRKTGDGYEPCDCGLSFDDVERLTVWPHEPVGGSPLRLDFTPEQAEEFRARMEMETRFPSPLRVLSMPAMPERPAEFEGVIRIEWRSSDTATGRLMPGWTFAIRDDAGDLITTVSRLTIHATADAFVWAQCEMWRTAKGRPVRDAFPDGHIETDEAGDILTGVFAFQVAGMSVAP